MRLKESHPDSKLNDEHELRELAKAANEKFEKDGRPPVPVDDDMYIDPDN